MSVRLLIALVLLLPSLATAQGLSSRECIDIQQMYNITPPECARAAASQPEQARQAQPQASAPSAPASGPTGSMRENHVFFSGGGTGLDATAERQIDRLARILQGQVMGQACLLLIGHSDSSGSAEANMRVAMGRAEQVRDALLARLPGPSRIEEIQSMGEEAPLAELPASSAWQRRVEIRARTCPAA